MEGLRGGGATVSSAVVQRRVEERRQTGTGACGLEPTMSRRMRLTSRRLSSHPCTTHGTTLSPRVDRATKRWGISTGNVGLTQSQVVVSSRNPAMSSHDDPLDTVLVGRHCRGQNHTTVTVLGKPPKTVQNTRRMQRVGFGFELPSDSLGDEPNAQVERRGR